jgi:hypothetical protein
MGNKKVRGNDFKKKVSINTIAREQSSFKKKLFYVLKQWKIYRF